jgi:hypothetical protein
MTAVKVRLGQFSGLGKVYSRDNDGLAAIVRGLAIDHARLVLEVSGVSDLTDNTTGTNGGAIVNMVGPAFASGVYNAVSGGGAQAAALNTSLGKIANASKVLVNSFNNARARIGLPPLSQSDGVQASANTLPAQDLTATTASGTSAADYQSTQAAFEVVRRNTRQLSYALNEILVAIGMSPLAITIPGSEVQPDYVIDPQLTIVAAVDGSSSVALADATAFLAAVANNYASLAYAWNSAMVQGTITALTDNSGGTAAASIVANANPATVDGAASTSAPKADFDTQLALVANAIASLAATTNILLRENSLPVLTDNSGGTVSTTLASESVALTAVDGTATSPAVALDTVTAAARMAAIDNALSSIAAKLNILAALYDMDPITDNLGGAVSGTLAVISATGAAVHGAASTMLNTAVNTWLTNNRNNISSLAALLDLMVGSNAPAKPLHVIAG